MADYNIKVYRRWFGQKETIGQLFLPVNKFFCYTLEDEIRKEKVKGETAIPYGKYPLTLSYSPKFGKILPLINNVPNFTGIRIHVGNTEADTDGCLLVGFNRTETTITQSTLALNALIKIIEDQIKLGNNVYIEFISYEKKIIVIMLITIVVLLIIFLIIKHKTKIF